MHQIFLETKDSSRKVVSQTHTNWKSSSVMLVKFYCKSAGLNWDGAFKSSTILCLAFNEYFVNKI